MVPVLCMSKFISPYPYLEFPVVEGDLLGAEAADVGGPVDDVAAGEARLELRLVHLVLRPHVAPEHERALEYP